MSTFFAWVSAAAEGVDERAAGTLPEAVMAALGHWKADAVERCEVAGAHFGQYLAHSTPESLYESLPRNVGAGGKRWVLVGDLRLDNRSELINALAESDGIRGRSPGEITDSALVIAAFLAWGRRCAERLLGDFAFALWESGERRLHLVRDPVGLRSLYVSRRNGGWLVSNDLRAFLATGEPSPVLNPDALANFLVTGALLRPTATYLDGVERLAPATWATIKAARFASTRYWHPEEVAARDYRSGEACAEALRSLLEDAVEVRLRTASPVVTHLSGGLDSAAVTALAASSRARPGTLLAVNWAEPPSVGEEAGAEWDNSARLSRLLDLPLAGVHLDDEAVFAQLASMDLLLQDSSDPWYEARVRRWAKANDARVVLSGWGGDELISYPGRRTRLDALLRGHPVRALRGLAGDQPGAGWSSGPRQLVKQIVLPLLRSLAPERRRGWHESLELLLGDCHPDIREAAREDPGLYGSRALTVRGEQLGLLAQGHLQNRVEAWSNAGKPCLLDYRYPLLDRRVVEFALAAPADFFRRAGQGRWLFRAALSPLLPAWLLEGNWKREPRRVERLLGLFHVAAGRWVRECGPPNPPASLPDGEFVLPRETLSRLHDRLTAASEAGGVRDQVLISEALSRGILACQAGLTGSGTAWRD